MRRFMLALVGAVCALIVLGGSLTAIMALGLNVLTLLISLGLWALASTVLVLSGMTSDRRLRKSLSQLGEAVGCEQDPKNGEIAFMQALATNLCQRLERAAGFKAAFAALETPALIVEQGGEVSFVSEGLKALEPAIVPGANLMRLFNAQLTPDMLGEAASRRVTIAKQPYDAWIVPIGGNKIVIGFARAGLVIGRSHLAAFTDALADGSTGFRFGADEAALFPALDKLNSGLEFLDRSVQAIDDLVQDGGYGLREPEPLNAGLSVQVRAVHDAISGLAAERNEEAERRSSLEEKLSAIGKIIDKHRKMISSIGEQAARAHADAEQVNETLESGRAGAQNVAELGRKARSLVTEANSAAQKTSDSVTNVEELTGQIDSMIDTIEDVSFRTNLLALNAAVEAARVGEKGAGFAVVAEEVRTLAHATAKSAKEIRALAKRGHGQSGESVSQVQLLTSMIGDLESHLRNISNETDIVAEVLDEGSSGLSGLKDGIAAMADDARGAVESDRQEARRR